MHLCLGVRCQCTCGLVTCVVPIEHRGQLVASSPLCTCSSESLVRHVTCARVRATALLFLHTSKQTRAGSLDARVPKQPDQSSAKHLEKFLGAACLRMASPAAEVGAASCDYRVFLCLGGGTALGLRFNTSEASRRLGPHLAFVITNHNPLHSLT